MMYKQGEIIIVPFPFSDLSSIKRRPVLVLSKSEDNKDSEDIITCGITSNLKNSKHSVLISNKDVEEGQIPRDSRIKLDKLFTLDKNIVNKKVALLKKDKFEVIRREFSKLI